MNNNNFNSKSKKVTNSTRKEAILIDADEKIPGHEMNDIKDKEVLGHVLPNGD